jgi:L-fuculose-phosphate aldolase
MNRDSILNLISNVSLALFRKDFFSIYNGSISAKIDDSSFLINTKNAIFDEIDDSSMIYLNGNIKDYRWKSASIESDIHNSIYTHIHEAKFIAFGMPPYATAYSLINDRIEFLDIYGKTILGDIDVYNVKSYSDWYDRAPLEIVRYMKLHSINLMVLKGVGVYIYDRDINNMLKKIDILENSCRLLLLKNNIILPNMP